MSKVSSYQELARNYLAMDSVSLMSAHGKSFTFASKILSKERLKKVTTLYKLCRFVDDCADELPEEESKQAIKDIYLQLKDTSGQEPFNQILNQISTKPEFRHQFRELVLGAEFDTTATSIETERDLKIYCYRVAGVVGLMMCSPLGVESEEAGAHAIDLGIGMQLTNICRDILEDAHRERSYIPKEVLSRADIGLETLKKVGKSPKVLKDIVKQLLDTADQYYLSAYEGLSFIPLRPRICILFAGEIYRHIGVKIRKSGYEVLQGRQYLLLGEKFWVVFKTLPKFFSPWFWRAKNHHRDLHYGLEGLPGVKG